MKHILLFLLLCTCFTVRSQNEFTDIKGEVTTWYETTMYATATTSKTPKSINFVTFHYAINGVIDKGKLAEGTIARFYDTSAVAPQRLLEGKVNYVGDRLVIEGVRYLKTPTNTNKLYGTFYVYNMDDFTMCYKTKKAGDLRIQRDKPQYFEASYLDRAAILRLKDVNSIYLDRKKADDKSFIFLSAPIPNISINDDDSFDIHQILLQVNDGVTMCWKNGTVFKGRVKPVPEAGLIRFKQLDGQRNSQVGHIKRITLSHENGDIVISQDFNSDEKQLSNKTWLIKDDGALSENDYWNWEKIPNLCYYTKWTYRNGNYLEGSSKFTITQNDATDAITINESILTGIFKYPNGDRFEGDLSSKSVGPFFTNGTTFFVDGSITKGNWLQNFKLNDSQWTKVYQCAYPSEARELARKFEHGNNYPEYQYDGRVEYFDPSVGDQQSLYYLIKYDKANKQYTCRYNDILLKFAVDGNGYRKWEIVYKDDKPKYKNYFTWYSNGVIESIKSYSCDTKNLYLQCNFFSDGKLRSAYQYGRGNNGENVIRKSKESHPSFGEYTCKLYDLNGNYERSIEWNIGVGESLFGGRHDKEMAPSRLIFSKLNHIDPIDK